MFLHFNKNRDMKTLAEFLGEATKDSIDMTKYQKVKDHWSKQSAGALDSKYVSKIAYDIETTGDADKALATKLAKRMIDEINSSR
ncbi:hypothetical protein VPHK567_0380 [Vibrio phage K567]